MGVKKIFVVEGGEESKSPEVFIIAGGTMDKVTVVPVYDEEHGVDAYFRQMVAEDTVAETGEDTNSEYGDLMATAKLLQDEDDPMSQMELSEEWEEGQEFATVKPKFNLRVKVRKAKKPPGKRGRPTKAEALEKAKAKAKAEGRPFIPPTAKPKLLSAKALAKKRAHASVSQKEHRERRNVAVNAIRKVLPGANPKLDTANTLELGVDFIFYTRKRDDIDIEAINREFLATLNVKND